MQASQCNISDKGNLTKAHIRLFVLIPNYYALIPLPFPIFAETYTSSMNSTDISIILSVTAILLALFAVFAHKFRPVVKPQSGKFDTLPMQLQAYERLVLLTERIALPNLISRLSQPGISAYEMKIILTENIKQEFDYNSTQQLYVSQVSWDAVRNLKEQNIMLVNQVSGTLPPTASAADLNKKILEVLMSQPTGALHELVAQALNFEAKKIMK